MIPCKECPVYVMCRQRQSIKCLKLYRYVTEQGRLREFPKEFPRLTSLSRDSIPYLSITRETRIVK